MCRGDFVSFLAKPSHCNRKGKKGNTKMNENVVKTKALAEKGKAAAINQLNKLSEKADAIPFFKGNMTRKLIALGGIIVAVVLCLVWVFGGSIESTVEDTMREGLNKALATEGYEVYDIVDIKLDGKGDNYEGTVNVIFKEKKTGKRTSKIKYDVKVKDDMVEWESPELIGAAVLAEWLDDDEQ